MRLRVHHRLFAGFLGVVVTLVAAIVLMVERRLGAELKTHYRTELTRELQLAGDVLSREGTLYADSVAGMMAERLGYRVTLIDSGGVVLGDSDVPRVSLQAVENHATRPEVVEAWQRGFGFAERTGIELPGSAAGPCGSRRAGARSGWPPSRSGRA